MRLNPFTPAVLLCLVLATAAGAAELMTAADLDRLRNPKPERVIAYGDEALQFGHLRLPDGPGPHPVVVLIHGGCWLAEYGIDYFNAMEQALADAGIAVWSLEYRRVGDEGGGWPGTFLDIADGVDYLRTLAEAHTLDLGRVVVSGHSAGGHLALWAGARANLAPDSDLFRPEPLPIQAVVALAPALDLEGLEKADYCGDVIRLLMDGTPQERPRRYAEASPMRFAPLDVPQFLLVGDQDHTWLPTGMSYYWRARTLRDDHLELIRLPDSGHFEMVAPGTRSWPVVVETLQRALRRNTP